MTFLDSTNPSPKKTAVALGIFDGVHLGHREILAMAESYSTEDIAFSVFTFETSSVEYKHGKPYNYIYTQKQKETILDSLGVEYIYAPKISELRDMTGEEFASSILKGLMKAETVVCGENFHFGKGASCGITELKAFGKKYGFNVSVYPTVTLRDSTVSSGTVKEFLRKGDIISANKLLGQKYFLEGTVVTGNRLGRTISFPTANQLFEERQVVPHMGAYATRCKLGGTSYRAVTNTGVKPTVESNIKPLAETHILGFSGDLYGKNIKIEFMDFLREERKFSSLEELKAQIKRDVEKSKGVNA